MFERVSNDVGRGTSSGAASNGQESPRPFKKRKLDRACDGCRVKKVRCDFVQLPTGDLDKCLNCYSTKTECTFGHQSKLRSSAMRNVEILEQKVQRAEELLARLCPDAKARQALLDGTSASLPMTPVSDATLSARSPSPTANEEARALLDQAAAEMRVRMHRFAKPPDLEVKEEADVDFPRLVPYNWHKDPTPGLFVGESSDPQIVIRALQMKELWQAESRPLTPSAASEGDYVVHIEESTDRPNPSSEDQGKGGFLEERRIIYWDTPWWEHSSPAILKSNQWLHKYRFPEPPLMKALLDLYFEHHNLLMPLIHRPTLQRELQEGLHFENEAFAATVLLMCALGSRYSDDPDVLLGEEDVERSLNALRNSQPSSASLEDKVELEKGIDRLREHWRLSLKHSRGWKYFEQTWEARGSLAVVILPSLYDVQASILSVSFMRFTTFPHIAWTALGVGLRLLQDLGGHRRIVNISRTISKSQEELLKRACWVMIAFDRMLSMATGRPWALRDEDIDMDLPTECDDEYWDHPDSQKRWKQPRKTPSLVSAFVANIRLLEILGTVLTTLYGTKHVLGSWNIDKKAFDKQVVMEADSALNTWLGSLPPHLVWDVDQPHIPFLIQSAVLHTMFYHIQILIHRPFIPTPRRPVNLGFPSLLVCTNAARAILKVCGTLLDRDCDIPAEAMLSIFSSGTVLLLKAWHTRRSRASDQQFKRDMEEVHKCMRILRAMEDKTFAAGKLWDLLDALASGGEADVPPQSQHQGSSTASANASGSGVDVSMASSIPRSAHGRPPLLRFDPSTATSPHELRNDQQTAAAPAAGFLPLSSSFTGMWHHSNSGFASASSLNTSIQRCSPSSTADGAPLSGFSSMFVPIAGLDQINPINSGFKMDTNMLEQPWPSLDAADPLSVATGMAGLWDWDMPLQTGVDHLSSLSLDGLMEWAENGTVQPSSGVAGLDSEATQYFNHQPQSAPKTQAGHFNHGQQGDAHTHLWTGY